VIGRKERAEILQDQGGLFLAYTGKRHEIVNERGKTPLAEKFKVKAPEELNKKLGNQVSGRGNFPNVKLGRVGQFKKREGRQKARCTLGRENSNETGLNTEIGSWGC